MGSGNIGATNVLRSKGKLAGLADPGPGHPERGAADRLRPHPFRPALDRPAGRPGRAAGPRVPGFSEIPRRQGRGHAGRRLPGFLLSRPCWCSWLVFFLTLWLTRYVSLGSLLGTTALFFCILFTQVVEAAMVAFVMLLLVVFRHRANIGRLLAGNENKFSFRKNG